jgi:aminoglycoside phosphotransferase (APT) family kinase protein
VLDTLPVDADGLTAEWVQHALEGRYPGVQVEAVEIVHRQEATNAHARLAVRYADAAGAPEAIFVKLPPADPEHRQAIGATGMGTREARFYADLADVVPMRVPVPHFAATGAGGDFVLLLEDLGASGCEVPDGLGGIPPDHAAAALADLAALHTQYTDPARLATLTPWVAAKQAASEWVLGTLGGIVAGNRDRLTDAYAATAEIYLDQHAGVEALWNSGPQSLIHGDPHIGNVFIDGPRVGFLDWGMLTVMPSMRDVSYFMTMSMTPADRAAHERDLLQHYLDARRSLGGSPITFDEAWTAHRVQAAYTVLASFLSFAPHYDTADLADFNAAFRARSFAALDDLETVAALRTLLA